MYNAKRMNEKIRQYIEALIKHELDKSKKENDEKFNTTHEGWAILKEEIEEYGDEINKIRQQLSYLNEQYEIISNYNNYDVWQDIKKNNYDSILASFEKLYLYGLNSIFEAIQMTAMLKKNIEFFNEKININMSGDVKND